jgi:hypothetical protein
MNGMRAKDTEIKVIQGGLMDGAGSIPLKEAVVVINFCGSSLLESGKNARDVYL